MRGEAPGPVGLAPPHPAATTTSAWPKPSGFSSATRSSALAMFSAMIRIRACWARMPEAATDIAASDWDRISAI